MTKDIINKPAYTHWVDGLKKRIQSTQIKAAIKVNQELLELYWEIGKSISIQLNTAKWGSSIVEQLAKDLRSAFPNQKGFARSNLFYMKRWFEFYTTENQDNTIVQQLVGQIPWGHNIVIISKTNGIDEAVFYCNKTIENNWSRTVLVHQIESKLYERQGKAITNFNQTLPKAQSELAQETLKDPYKFDFLNLQEKAVEKDIEKQLVAHITSFLLELGAGFSFVGQQVALKVGDTDFYIDLLFYHIKLKCYVVIELKTIEFKAEFAGKMNMYLPAVDDLMKDEWINLHIIMPMSNW